MSVSKVNAAIITLDVGSTLCGGWELLRDPLADRWNAISEAFMSAANTLTGNAAAAASDAAAELSLEAAKQPLMCQTAKLATPLQVSAGSCGGSPIACSTTASYLLYGAQSFVNLKDR